MSFSLSHFSPKNPQTLATLFQCLGKALYIASMYESKCDFVLKYLRLTDFYQNTPTRHAADAITAITKKMPRKLAKKISEISTFDGISKSSVEALDEARSARNWIAHEGGLIGHVWEVDDHHAYTHLEQLRREVARLAKGDHVVSGWVYIIEEKDPHVPLPQYPAMIDDWIFGWWDESIPERPQRISGTEALRRALDKGP